MLRKIMRTAYDQRAVSWHIVTEYSLSGDRVTQLMLKVPAVMELKIHRLQTQSLLLDPVLSQLNQFLF
jgi:hypothetical protein